MSKTDLWAFGTVVGGQGSGMCGSSFSSATGALGNCAIRGSGGALIPLLANAAGPRVRGVDACLRFLGTHNSAKVRLQFFGGLFCLLVLLALCGVANAQTGLATLSGQVSDSSGKVVPGVSVVLTNLNTNVPYSTNTNGDGIYNLSALPPGIYRANLSKDGFKSIVKGEVELHTQDNVSLNFALQVGSVSEVVTVSAGGININTSDATVSTIVDGQFVQNMPLNGRSFQSLITLAPGVLVVPSNGPGQSGEFSVNGQRPEGNYFTVDGVSANTGSSQLSGVPFGAGGALPSESALGTTQSLVSIDALQEFRVQTSSYSAENGRTPGGQISFVTRSGTNDWHGSAFEYFRNEALDANNWFNNAEDLPRSPERQNDFGGTLGGPFVLPDLYDGHDRSFFFFSYEGLRLQTPQPALRTQVPSMSLRQSAPVPLQPFLNAFPVPQAGTDIGDGLAVFAAAYSNPSTLDATSIRVDQKINDNFRLFGRFSDSPSDSGSRFPADLANVQHAQTDVKSLTLGSTNFFSRMTNQLRFNFTWNRSVFQDSLDNFGGAVPFDVKNVKDAAGESIPNLDYAFMGLQFGNSPSITLNHTFNSQRQLNITDSLGVVHGRHSFTFGIDYRRLWTPIYLRKLAEGALFTSSAEILQNTPIYNNASSDSLVPLEPIYTNFSAFAQDEWRFTPRLNLSLGLRWELSPPPTDAHGNLPYTLNEITDLATAQIAPKGTPLWATTYNNFAPRLGLAYQARQTPGNQTVIRGGVGLFYDLNNIFASAGYNGIGYYTGYNPPSGTPFPIPGGGQSNIPPASVAPPYNSSIYAFDPHLKLPRTMEWNVALEQQLGQSQAITITYVGAAGHRLATNPGYNLNGINPNFGPFAGLNISENGATSDYQSLQSQFQRRLASGLQVLASYTFSHSIDDSSSNFGSTQLTRGNSAFDIRHSLQAAATYEIPNAFGEDKRFLKALLGGWGTDWRITGRTALPLDIIAAQNLQPNGFLVNQRADVVPGVPVYLNDPAAPGGRIVNGDAFSVPVTGYGNAPRNSVREFSTWQADCAIRREFQLYERLKLQFRAEAFNLFNRPNFGDVQGFLPAGPGFFGVAYDTVNNQLGGLSPLYQVGGPRSLQLALKLVF